MPQPRGNSSRSSSSSGSGGRSGSTRRSSSASGASRRTASGSGTSAKRSTSSRAKSASKTTASKAGKSSASAASRAKTAGTRATETVDQRVEAVAARVRKLNERIIDASKEAGETTLTAYEKALKSLAASIERGAGRSDIEWVSDLLNTQAKFIRDVTSNLTSAARGALKK